MCKLTCAIGNALGGLFGCVSAYEEILCSPLFIILLTVRTLSSMVSFQPWKGS